MTDDAIQMRAPGASTSPPPRPTRSPAAPVRNQSLRMPDHPDDVGEPRYLLPPLPGGEVRKDVFRSTGPGAVRLTHIPTGIVATGDGGGSEAANLRRAQLLLRARLLVARLEREANG